MNKVLEERVKILEKQADDLGIDYYPLVYEVVGQETMLEVMSYGLPTRARHWSYGQSYEYQKMQGEMGFSKVYEVVLNNDPSYSFLLDTNSDIINSMIIAHVIGHCFAGETLINTSDGPVQIQDLEEGVSLVETRTGSFNKVLAKKKTKEVKKIIELKIKGNDSIIRCTPEHRILVNRDGYTGWVMAKDITLEDLVPEPMHNSIITDDVNFKVPIHVSKSTRKAHKALAKTGGFPIVKDAEFGRILGLYIAEGWFTRNNIGFGLHSEEAEYAECISTFFEKYNLTASVVPHKTQKAMSVMVYETSFGKWFSKHCGIGSWRKRIPKMFFESGAPKEFWLGLIRGLFEGDGHIPTDNYFSSYSTTSHVLAYQIKALLRGFGIKSSLRSRKRSNRRKNYDLGLSGRDYRNLLKICDLEFEKKINRTWSFNELDENFLYSRIDIVREVELLEAIPVWDIEVENDHSFIVSDGLTAHNSAVFKTNYLFKQTDNKMVYHAAERAQRIEEYINQHGLDAVERTMDIGFALDKHIDWHKGIHRKPYEAGAKTWEDVKKDEFSDLLDKKSFSKKSVKPNKSFPPAPEFDLLWFLITYSQVLDAWQVDVLDIIRKESYYFFPQYQTKILNEGFASQTHADLMHSTGCISDAEHLEFCKVHEKVVQPGGNKLNINPYFLGFTILNDIKARWNKLHEDGESEINGMQKVLEVIRDEDDISFIRNYLTKELAEELKLFTYVGVKMASGDEAIHVLGTELDMIKDSLTKDLYNYRSPLICITGIEDGILQLEHRSGNIGTLDYKHLETTLEYMFEAWGNPVNIETVDSENNTIHFTYDESGFSG